MIERLKYKFTADAKRALLLFFYLSEERSKKILDRILSLPKEIVNSEVSKNTRLFEHRHKNFETLILNNFKKVESLLPDNNPISDEVKKLIGFSFSKEYTIESAALFNPSIVLHPDQKNLLENEIRFIISLRAVGEGHISSIEFITGIFNGIDIKFEERSKYLVTYTKKTTPDYYLNQPDPVIKEANYDISFSGNELLSERIIFPSSSTEINGMEDLRLVRFVNDDGSIVYYGTFTAYDGRNIHPQLLETTDFINFKIRTLGGKQAADKGIALFPRKVNGKYAMISRQDGENIRIMFSDDIYLWEESTILKSPKYGWDAIQLGNCGSPIETPDGWLLFTHAVGPFRRYV
ncbi:MAG: glycosidase, partial [Bacteroidota bacterium]|nr:glycosidase [Bacteroidota bacterium]